MMVKLFIILIFFVNLAIYAEGYLSIGANQNYGEHIFETGNKSANISGTRGGSRITYNRDFEQINFQSGYFYKNLEFSIAHKNTGWYQKAGISRDEDFYLGSASTERGSKISLKEGKIYDTAHTFTGTLNFADGKGKTTVGDHLTELGFKYYLFSKNSSYWIHEDKVFLSLGVRYNYVKYYLYDVMQFVDRPLFYGPIGIGLSYSQNTWEYPIGFGTRIKANQFFVEGSFQIYFGVNFGRDFHVQRNINFLSKANGSGFSYRLESGYLLSNDDILSVSTYGHRNYARGFFVSKGGITESDILSNYVGHYKSYINIKEIGYEFSYKRRFGN